MAGEPLSVVLSRLLLAQTIELDNAFEERMAARLERPFRVSVVMWSNFLRFVGDGITVGELPVVAAIPKPRMLSTLGGLERWRYVSVGSPGSHEQPTTKRDGYGSARALESEWVVRPTEVGRAAQEIWPPLFDEIEERWHARLGTSAVAELGDALSEVVDGLDAAATEYLPIVGGTNGMRSEIAGRQEPSDPIPPHARLAQALLAYTLEFEREAPLSLVLSETVVRSVGETGTDVRELPARAAISPEAVSMALTYLTKHGHAEVAERTIRLTPSGVEARAAIPEQHARVESAWNRRLGRARVERLRSAATALLDQRNLAEGLTPPAGAWRLEPRYRAQTKAMVADPLTGLPRHPVILHRGGWPDGS